MRIYIVTEYWPEHSFKDLPRRTTSDKLLRNKVFNIAKNSKYDGYQRDLAAMFYKFFDKKASSGVATSAR